MITLAKLQEYKGYEGRYDGFYLQRVKRNTNITSSSEWSLIERLLQDIKLVKRGRAAKEYSDNVNRTLEEQCDGRETIEFLLSLADEKW